MDTISLATAARASSPLWKNQQMPWSEFVDRLSRPQITHETYAEYMGMPKADQDRIKDVGGYVGGYLLGGRRKNRNLSYRTLLTLDIDFAQMGFVYSFSTLYDWEAVIHSTHKHASDNVRLRLVMRLSREVTPDEYEAVARWIAGQMGIEIFDPTTFQPARMMFWPSHSKGAEWVFEHFDGQLVDVDWVLSQYVNWQDISEWPVHDGVTKAPKWLTDSMAKQENPLDKKGIVGVFCRTYDIDEVIHEFLGEQYEPTPDPNRYTYTQGSTKGGLVIYENLWAYSFHGSDPASGKLCNAFDLARIHRFGHLDEGSAASGNKQKSYAAMRQWSLTLTEVKATAVNEAIDEYKFDAVIPQGSEDEVNTTWHEQLQLDESAKPKATIFNIRLILRHDQVLKEHFALNDFDKRRYLMDSLGDRELIVPEPVLDVDYSYVRGYIETTYNITGSFKIDDGIALEFNRNKFHPVREYLQSLDWDGTVRIPKLLQQVFGVEDNPYTREVLKCWMTAAVARIFNPGVKFDEMLVIVGPQGTGKSSFLKKLGKAWYSDSFSTVNGKEAFEQLQGAWLMEIAELSAFRKADAEMVKHFVSKCTDRFRPAYGRVVEDYPRQVVFAGTTNERNFLTDIQNRRYWPVVNRPGHAEFTVWDERFTKWLDQYWAEAVYYYFNDGGMLLSREAEAIVNQAREEHRVVDDRRGVVEDYLNLLLPTDWSSRDVDERRAWLANPTLRAQGTVPRTTICNLEVWCECFGRTKEEASRYNMKDLNDIMRVLPNWTQASGTRTFPPYGKQRYYTYEL